MKHSIIFLASLLQLYAQNVDLYLSLIHEGQAEGVKDNLPELISKYPNNPGVIYLQALLTTNGFKSLELYGKIIDKFPDSEYAGLASVKIGEYFYARGLYSQAGKQLSTIPRKYPRLGNLQQVIDMMVSSFRAIGEEDTLKYYVGIYQSMYPSLNTEKYGVDKLSYNRKNDNFDTSSREPKPYVIQIGAFGNIQNANRLKLQVTQIGYEVDIVPIQTNGKGLHTVRVIRYKSKSSAERVGNLIKKKLGIDYRVLYRPKN